MTRDRDTLTAVATARRTFFSKRAELQEEAAAWVEKHMEQYELDVERAVMAAIADEHKITDIGEAYTISGRTPDRTSIYKIKNKHEGAIEQLWADRFPFEWTERSIETAAGTATVYDAVAELHKFGPSEVTGEFTWVYDRISRELEQVLTPDSVPYPLDEKYYKQLLDRWLLTNPYPGGE